MRWDDFRRSENVEDAGSGGGFGGGFKIGGGALIAIVVISLLLGKNPLDVLTLLETGAPGDFARAYVVAHEVGHHVQNQLGLMREVQQKAENASDRTRNALSVRQELQADCFAGVWGHSAQQRGALDTRDVEQGIAAAS